MKMEVFGCPYHERRDRSHTFSWKKEGGGGIESSIATVKLPRVVVRVQLFKRRQSRRFWLPATKKSLHISVNPLSWLFFSFIKLETALQTTRPLYNDLKRWTQGNSFLLTILSILVFLLPLAFLHHCSFFSQSIEWDGNGSLTAGLDGHGIRLQGSQKT
jgi:hypothetical protein